MRIIALAVGLLVYMAMASNPANADEWDCPCFDAIELKQEIRFVSEMAALEGNDTTNINFEILRPEIVTDNRPFHAHFEYQTDLPDDTFTVSSIYVDRVEEGLVCIHGFWFDDRPVHHNKRATNLTEAQVLACTSALAEALAKAVKDGE